MSSSDALSAGSGISFADLLWGFCPVTDKERLKTIDSVSGRCKHCHLQTEFLFDSLYGSHMRSDKVPSSSYETRDSSDGVTTIYCTSHLAAHT